MSERTDTERLDWLSARLAEGLPGGDLRGVDIDLGANENGVTIYHGNRSGDWSEFESNGPTLRAAIDAAMDASGYASPARNAAQLARAFPLPSTGDEGAES